MKQMNQTETQNQEPTETKEQVEKIEIKEIHTKKYLDKLRATYKDKKVKIEIIEVLNLDLVNKMEK